MPVENKEQSLVLEETTDTLITDDPGKATEATGTLITDDAGKATEATGTLITDDPGKATEATGTLITDDPGKATELIQKFQTAADAANKPSGNSKERQRGNRFSEDRLNFLNKKDDVTSVTPLDVRGVKPGGGDRKWSKKLEEEEKARKSNLTTKWQSDKTVQLEAELKNAGLECSERSRRLSELRERYSIMSSQFRELQELLGLATGNRKLFDRSDKRKACDGDSEPELVDTEDKELLQERASEMKDKLAMLMEADKRNAALLDTVQAHEAAIRERDHEIASCKDQVNSLLENIKLTNDHLDGKILHYEQNIDELQTKVEAYQQELRSKEDELLSLKDTMGDSSTQALELKRSFDSSLAKKDAEVIKYTELYESLKNEITSLKSSFDLERESLQSSISELEQKAVEFENLNDAHEITRVSLDKLEETLADARARVTQMELALQEKGVENESLHMECQTLKKDMTSKEQDREQLIADLSLLRMELSHKNEKLEEANHEVKLELEMARSSLEEAKAREVELREQLQKMDEDRLTFMEKLSLKEEALISVKADIEKHALELDTTRDQLRSSEDLVRSLREEAQAIQAEIVVYQESVANSNRDQSAFESNHQTLCKDYEALQLRFQEQETKIQQLAVDHEHDCCELRGRIAATEKEKVELGERIEDMIQGTIMDGNERLSEMQLVKEENDKIVAQLRLAKDENDQVVAELEEAKGKVLDELRVTISRDAEEKAALNASLEDVRAAVALLEKERDDAMRANEEKVVDLEARCESLVGNAHTMKENTNLELVSLAEKNAALQTEVDALQNTLAKMKVAATETAQHNIGIVQSMEHRIECLEKQLDAAKRGEVELHNEMNNQRASMVNEMEQIKLCAANLAIENRYNRVTQSLSIGQSVCELNVVTVATTDSNTTKGADSYESPPYVIGIDMETTASNKEIARSYSLKDYVDVLNMQSEQLAKRNETFANRLEKIREMDADLRRREDACNERIKRVKSKESHIFDVVRSLKERESELKTVSQDFERFRSRLHQSCWDDDTATFMNKTLPRPDTTDKLANTRGTQKTSADDSDPTTFITSICMEECSSDGVQ